MLCYFMLFKAIFTGFASIAGNSKWLFSSVYYYSMIEKISQGYFKISEKIKKIFVKLIQKLKRNCTLSFRGVINFQCRLSHFEHLVGRKKDFFSTHTTPLFSPDPNSSGNRLELDIEHITVLSVLRPLLQTILDLWDRTKFGLWVRSKEIPQN